MFFPLKDNIPSFHKPYVNNSIIAVNAAIFLFELSLGAGSQKLVQVFGFVPARFLHQLWLHPLNLGEAFFPIFSSMFLHGGWLHIIGNMWFLFIFGDNVEDTLGHRRYLFLYLACGVAACFSQLLAAPDSRLPMIGASGAIAGVMGAYFFLFPRARVLTLVFIILFITVVEIPAYIFLGLWFVMQFFFGALVDAAMGGVAFWAHVGGFLVGIFLIHLLIPHQIRGPFRRRV
jgi:hypothetical protein